MRRHEILTLFIDWPVSLVEEGIDFRVRIVHAQRRHNLERHHRNAITARAHGLQSHMIRTILGRQSINASAG
ncbi:hypothetical protein A7J57_01480 [Agrobacterium tumefaciens]|uniref:Transposase n=1 Tax=Agrobacterium tumefaciens TaxID=358 RepID=A0A176X4E9_AGRTU|nr:hypothetical protein A7J57_01480 [Agrobacterium tumefaciens]